MKSENIYRITKTAIIICIVCNNFTNFQHTFSTYIFNIRFQHTFSHHTMSNGAVSGASGSNFNNYCQNEQVTSKPAPIQANNDVRYTTNSVLKTMLVTNNSTDVSTTQQVQLSSNMNTSGTEHQNEEMSEIEINVTTSSNETIDEGAVNNDAVNCVMNPANSDDDVNTIPITEPATTTIVMNDEVLSKYTYFMETIKMHESFANIMPNALMTLFPPNIAPLFVCQLQHTERNQQNDEIFEKVLSLRVNRSYFLNAVCAFTNTKILPTINDCHEDILQLLQSFCSPKNRLHVNLAIYFVNFFNLSTNVNERVFIISALCRHSCFDDLVVLVEIIMKNDELSIPYQQQQQLKQKSQRKSIKDYLNAAAENTTKRRIEEGNPPKKKVKQAKESFECRNLHMHTVGSTNSYPYLRDFKPAECREFHRSKFDFNLAHLYRVENLYAGIRMLLHHVADESIFECYLANCLKNVQLHYVNIQELQKCLPKHCVLDGELVAKMGCSRKAPKFNYFVFDATYINGIDLRGLTLADRLRYLHENLNQYDSDSFSLKFAEVVEIPSVQALGDIITERSESTLWPGVVLKRIDSTYLCNDWLRVTSCNFSTNLSHLTAFIVNPPTELTAYVAVVGAKVSKTVKTTDGFNSMSSFLIATRYNRNEQWLNVGTVGVGISANCKQRITDYFNSIQTVNIRPKELILYKSAKCDMYLQPENYLVVQIRYTEINAESHLIKYPKLVQICESLDHSVVFSWSNILEFGYGSSAGNE